MFNAARNYEGSRTKTHTKELDQAEIYARDVIRRFRASGDLWGEAEVFEPVIAALRLGRISEIAPLVKAAAPIAERAGRTAALWAY
jgi:hypothetical protein